MLIGECALRDTGVLRAESQCGFLPNETGRMESGPNVQGETGNHYSALINCLPLALCSQLLYLLLRRHFLEYRPYLCGCCAI
ncbi:MAG TPA: hypothetical protein VFF81_00215 [Noviherbaspirillum sp.]|nr:hypothetical protein [Noviherbaspirillum sp.]